MKLTIRIFETICVLAWIAGMFFSGELRALLWAIPAGYCAGTITAKYYFEFLSRKDKPIKTIMFDDDNAPPDLKDKMQEVVAILEREGKLPPQELRQKCDDPHCPGCWGYGEQ